MNDNFNAMLIDRTDVGQWVTVADLVNASSPEGDVSVSIRHSTVHEEDALASTGRSPVAPRVSMATTIDLVGAVEVSQHAAYAPGDCVIQSRRRAGESYFRWAGTTLSTPCRLTRAGIGHAACSVKPAEVSDPAAFAGSGEPLNSERRANAVNAVGRKVIVNHLAYGRRGWRHRVPAVRPFGRIEGAKPLNEVSRSRGAPFRLRPMPCSQP